MNLILHACFFEVNTQIRFAEGEAGIVSTFDVCC